MRKEPGRGLTLVRSQELELGQRSEPWPVTLMSYGDTPRPRSMVTASGQSPALGRTASRGAVGPSPLIPTAFYSKGTARASRPRGQLRDMGRTLTGSRGRGHSPGTLSENTTVVVTACPALMLRQALWGLPVRPPASLGPHRDPRWRNWHGAHFTEEATEAQGAQGSDEPHSRPPPAPSPGAGPAHWPLPLGSEEQRCLWAGLQGRP